MAALPPRRPVTAHAAPDTTHLRVWQGCRELSVECSRPGQQALVRAAQGQLAERREQGTVAPRCRGEVRRPRGPSPVGRQSSSVLDRLALHRGGPNGENPHAHLMFSERGNDGIARDAAQWFKRHNPTAPAQGGARKSRAAVKQRTATAQAERDADRRQVARVEREIAGIGARLKETYDRVRTALDARVQQAGRAIRAGAAATQRSGRALGRAGCGTWPISRAPISRGTSSGAST